MKVLWITNIVFPEALAELTGSSDLKSSGGWMLGAANALLANHDVELHVASVSPLVNEINIINGERIIYHIIPFGKGNQKTNQEYEHYWQEIKAMIDPDVVHIHGTEYSHGHAYLKACGKDNVVLSIQGLTSAYYYYYYYGISKTDIYRNITLRDIVKGTIISGQRNFIQRSKYEIEMLKMTSHVIGRTSWDKARTWAINPRLHYHFCNETLRSEFYEGLIWNYEKCQKHSIFLSQASYPIKGLHQLLKAMPLILREYPDTKIRIAGNDITKHNSFKDFIRYTGYGRYINNLIKKYRLEKHITFIGNLNAAQMRNEYLQANVFICPSTIENSPNSLGEAQILGVPCISSYVGGAMDMMENNTDNLYRFEEVEMLAYKVCQIFANKEKQVDMRNTALNRHNPQSNALQLYNIYQSILRR